MTAFNSKISLMKTSFSKNILPIVLDQGANYISLSLMPVSTSPQAIFGLEVLVYDWNRTEVGDWGATTNVAPGVGYFMYAPHPKVVVVSGTGNSLPTTMDWIRFDRTW
jgi:hypothetical protein